VARRVLDLTSQAVLGSGKVAAHVSGARVMLPSQKATSLAIILGELVDNALRHGLSNAKPGRLAISLAEAGGEVVVQVKDNGVGLPAGFDLTTSPGLGLSIAKGVAERDLGGKLELESKAGLTVRIRFPK
jgi:two-component sensor histidine kinase